MVCDRDQAKQDADVIAYTLRGGGSLFVGSAKLLMGIQWRSVECCIRVVGLQPRSVVPGICFALPWIVERLPQCCGCVDRMMFSHEALLTVLGFAVLFCGAAAFWWLDRRADTVQTDDPVEVAFRAMPDAVLVLRAVRTASGGLVDFNCAWMNAAAENILGIRAVDLVGSSVRKSIPAFNEPAHFAECMAYLEHGLEPSAEVRSDQHGQERWWRRSIARAGDGLVLVLRDITRMRERERYERMAGTLEALSSAARVAVHDLRDPLTNLSLTEDRLREEVANKPTAVPYLDLMRSNIDRAREVIDRMVAAHSMAPSQRSSQDAHDMIRTIVDSLSDRITADGLSVIGSYAAEKTRMEVAIIPLYTALRFLLSAFMDLLPSGSELHIRTSDQGTRMSLEWSASIHGIHADRLDGFLRGSYKILPVDDNVLFGHAHAILHAHNTVLEFGKERGSISVRIALPADQ